jgi:hypothetical protein
MAPDPYPNLGFDPCPGDLGGYQALAAYTTRSAATLTSAVSTLASAGSQEWRGQAADAFRAHVQEDVLPLARTASGSVGRAATALHNWALTLGGLQDEAKTLDRQAEPYRTDLEATLRAAGLPPTATPPYPAKLTSAQTARVHAANTALAGILAKADDVHTRYLDAVRAANSQLDNAGNMAPHPPGLFASLWHDAASRWDEAVRGLDNLVHDKALLSFISGVCNVIATVAGLLALFPPLTLIFGPIALAAAGFAMVMDMLLAGFDHESWSAVGLDAISMAADAGWMKAASKLTEIYKASGVEMKSAKTLTGLVTGKRVDVAPGLFKMIGASLKEAAGGTNTVAADMNRIAMKDFSGSAIWRSVDITTGQLSWSTAAGAIEAIPGNVRTWVNDGLTGKTPWQESASKSTGL